MKITIEHTTKICQVNGVPARCWEGKTEGGTPVVAFIVRLAVPESEDTSVLERELMATPPIRPAMAHVFDARLAL